MVAVGKGLMTTFAQPFGTPAQFAAPVVTDTKQYCPGAEAWMLYVLNPAGMVIAG